MKNNDVLIQKIVFDLDIDSPDNYQLYFEIISAFVKNNFSKILEEIGAEYSQSNNNYFLDKVEIDLDEIDIENLSFIEPLLKEKIQQQIIKLSKSKESISKFQSNKFNLEQLIQFISDYGFLPWSFNTKEKVNNFFRASIKNYPNKKSLFKILLKDEKSFLRISNTLTSKNNDFFFKALLKTEYKFYQQIIEFNKSILNENKSLSIQHKQDQVIFYILNLFNKHSLEKDVIIEKSIDFFKTKYSIPSEDLGKIKDYQTLNFKKKKIHPKEIKFKSLIRIFVEIEKKQLLKKIFTQEDQYKKLLDRGFYSASKVVFAKALDQIIKVYETTHKHTPKEIVLNLISFLVKKPRLLKTELLTVSLLGEELIQNKSYKGILNERVIADLVKLLENKKDSISKAILDKIALLLPRHKKIEHLNFIRITFFKYFQKNLHKPNMSDLFSEILNSLIKKDPNALPFNSSFLKSKSVTRLQTYLDQHPEFKGVSKKKSKVNTITQADDQYFDFILNLNNEVVNDQQLDQQNESKEYISLNEILKSPTTLFDFLKTYASQNELINLFSEITLRVEINTKFSKLLKKKFEQWINLEKDLISIQNKIHFSELSTTKFRSVLRYFLIKSLSELSSSDQLIEGEFTFNFLTFLETESNIEYSRIKTFLEFEYPQDISEGFKVMIDVNQYSQTPEKARSWFYFRDLYYFYLKTNEIPEWSNIEKIDTVEIINFINLLIKRNEKVVLNKIFNDDDVIINLSSWLDNEPKEFFYQLIQTLENNEQPLKLSLLLQKIIDQLPKKSVAFPAFVQQVFSRKLWNKQSAVFLHEQLMDILTKVNPNFKSNLKTKFIDTVDQVFKESKLRKEFKSPRKKINKTELNELLKYLIDNNSLPSKYEYNRIEIITQLIEYLSKNPEVSINYIKEIIVDFNYESKLIDVFTIRLLQQTLYVYLTLTKEVIQYLDLFFEKIKNQKTAFELTKRLFIAFVIKKNNDKFLLSELFQITGVSLTEGFKTGDFKFDKIFQKDTQIIPQELSKKYPELTLQSDLLAKEVLYEHSVLNQKNIFNALKYYVEFGSSSYENLSYNKAMYLQIFGMQSRLSIKKHLHSWAKQGQKLDRFMELFSNDKEKETLLELIHFKLKDLVIELFILLQELNLITPNQDIKKHLTQKQVKEILVFWSKRNIKIDDPYQLISDLIKNFLDDNRIDSDQFLIQLPKVNWATKKNLSEKELIQVFKKPLPKIKKNVEIATKDKFEDQIKEGISISNAGLVIAWPFLTTLFTKLGLTENNEFKDDLSIQKGIIATQYLVEGINEFDESKLVLNKILCGVDVDFYVDNSIDLIDVETAVCDMALKAIIQQWDKIKSVETLREYFLKREGVLKLTESGYQLYIKAQTTDALLRFLPWNLSIIKSSIMQTKLTIDWKYI